MNERMSGALWLLECRRSDLADKIAIASGDAGIDARDGNDRMLLGLIVAQEHVISALAEAVKALAAEIASLDRVLASRTEHMA